MKIFTDVEIVLQQESDTVAQVNGDLSTLEFVARTRDRIVLLEARWQACGLPQGDATKTLRSVALRAHAESSGV